MLLSEIAQVFQGLTSRLTGKKKMNYIRVKRLNSLVPLKWEWFEIIKGKPLPYRYYLQPNDLLLTSVIHNKKIKAVLYNLPEEKVICQSNTLVVRLKLSDFLPKFLLIYLTHFALEQLRLTGHKNPTIHKISVSALKQLSIPKYEDEQQRKIIKIYNQYTWQLATLQDSICELQSQYQEIEKERLSAIQEYF